VAKKKSTSKKQPDTAIDVAASDDAKMAAIMAAAKQQFGKGAIQIFSEAGEDYNFPYQIPSGSIGLDLIIGPAKRQPDGRWQAGQLSQMSPHELNEVKLHGTNTRCTCSRWKVTGRRHALLAHLLSGIKQSRRDSTEGSTVKQKEFQSVIGDPGVRALHVELLQAQYIAKLLEGMGDRFAQLKNGLKRRIDLVVFGYKRASQSGTL